MLGIGDVWPLIWMDIMVYSGTDPDTIAAVTNFNAFFSIVFQMGVIAFIFTLICTTLARS